MSNILKVNVCVNLTMLNAQTVNIFNFLLGQSKCTNTIKMSTSAKWS